MAPLKPARRTEVMIRSFDRGRRAIIVIGTTVCAATVVPSTMSAQMPAVIGTDSVSIAAGPGYAAGGLRRALLGDNYRDEWTTPIKVPVLNLGTFAGGLTPTRLGGGRQTRSLRFVGRDSAEFVFRPVLKAQTILPEHFRNTIIWSVFKDQGSASHPGATTAAAPVLEALGILHPTPRLAVMPDDPRLGQYQKEFAGLLGSIEEYPLVPKQGVAFAGATEIVDAEAMLEKLNADGFNRVDARTLLRARLVDMLLNDNDRHPDQWRWARMSPGGETLWVPIPRDRDKVFLSYEGLLLDMARMVAPALVKFDSRFPKGSALFENAMEFDRRMLGSLDRNAWETEAIALKQKITDDVIDRGIRAMPREYTPFTAEIISKLRARRDQLPSAALGYYAQLWSVADIHGTDAADQASISRSPDGSVTIELRAGSPVPYFARRFDPAETKEIRVYLHDGDDDATVTGSAATSIPVKVIGGNGKNFSGITAVGSTIPTTLKLYDVGTVSGVKYDLDSVAVLNDGASELDARHNRRPWVAAYGTLVLPQRDRGAKMKPVVGMRTGHGIGLTPKIGVSRTAYGFRYVPYASKIQGDVAYSFVHRGYAVNLFGDKRFRSSDLHVPVDLGVTQLDMVRFRGFGNDTPERDEELYEVKQTAWNFRPAIGLSFNEESDLTFGPIVRYTKTDSISNRFISQLRPYGFTTFAQAGAQLKLHYDTRPKPDTTKLRAVLDFAASGYPGVWDAETAYQSLEGAVTAYINIPVGTRPVLALR